MRKNLVKDLSATTSQVVFNQLFGLVVFYITSRFLNREVYGELNWSLALISTIVIVLGLGMEQILVRRIVANKNGISSARVFIFYTIISSTVFIAFLLVINLLPGDFFDRHYLIMGIAGASIISYLSNPFKQLVFGKENFTKLAILSVLSNFIKAILLTIIVFLGKLTTHWIIVIYILSSFAELVAGILVTIKMKIPLNPKWDKKEFKSMIRESLPQLGVIIFDSALARIDWILLGFVIGALATAEYSFAYKIFEISRLPMLIIAPILLTKLSRYFANAIQSDQKKRDLELIYRFEIAVAFIMPIIFNVVWTPFFEILTNGKYGEANKNIYLVLSLSVPLHSITNFLWTIAFAKQQLKQTFIITMLTSSVNILLNILLIPMFGVMGAAIAFTGSTIFQVLLYKRFIKDPELNTSLYPFFLCMIIATVIVIVLTFWSFNFVVKGLVGVLSYVVFLFFLKVITPDDIKKIRFILQK